MPRIISADNQFITKVGLNTLLSQIKNDLTIENADTKKELLVKLGLDANAIVILDYSLFDFQSVNELIILQERFKQTDWLIYVQEISDEFVRTLLFNTHSFGILMKDSTREETETALREILNGRRFICNHISNILLDTSKRREKQIKPILTITEQEILKDISLGKTTKEIADIRHVSIHTVMTHRKNIFRKIEVNNVHEATKYAIKAGIVDMTEYYI